MDKFLSYVSEYGGTPKPGVISSKPSVGGEFVNMYGLPSDRKLKEALDKIPNVPFDPNFKLKSRFRK